MSVPRPANEEERLQELHQYDILDTEPEKAFDDVARLAAQICHVPFAFVTLIDRERQWFKARFGVDVSEIPRDLSFCAHTILTPELMHVTDTALDPRFRDSPLVISSTQIRFYAGAPLVGTNGHAFGTLCVVDNVPRTLSEEQRKALEDLSHIVVAQLDLRRTVMEQAEMADALREREHQLQVITDNVPLLISRIAPDLRYTFANRTYQDMLQVSPDQVIGHTMHEVLGERAFAVIRPYAERALAGERVTFTSWIAYSTVGPRYTQVSYIPEFGPDGEVCGFLAAVMDITERETAERTLSERTEVLENVLATIPHQVFWKDRSSVYLGCNPKFAHAAGAATPAGIIGKNDRELHWERTEMEAHLRNDQRVVETGTALLDQQEKYRHEDGKVTTGLTSRLPLRDAGGCIIGVLGISQDISERQAFEDEREHLLEEMERLLAAAVDQADRDPLTGLLNHRAFHKRLEEEAERAERTGTTLAVAMLDLDHFKFFNDTYGHPAGDDVLRRVAEGLSQRRRPTDTVARFGGDKFALLMPGLNQAEATHLTRRLIAGLDRQGYMPPGHDVSVPLSLSLGLAVFPTEADARLETLDLAAARLRVAKTGGDEAAAAALDVRTTMSRKVEGFAMLDALVAAVDNKDRYTRRHSEDVLAYSVEIARRLGLDKKTQHTIAVAALLHDVGKIGVPDRILRKPGRLTDEEFEAMRQHPMMGAIIVGAVPGFEEALDAVRHHHERWDGGGYPFGLRGEETPLMARLMAVADAFSAMTTDRPYRKGMGEAKALTILRDGAGTQWDPACVHAFLETRSSGENPAMSQ